MTTLEKPDLLRPGAAVLVGDFAQGSRTRRGERLDHVFEEQCDWIASYGPAGHLAVDTGDVRLTYPELDARANQLARELLARGARPGDRIALLFDQPVHSYIAMLAVLKVGAAYVPLDVAFPADRIAYIVEDSSASMVLSLSHVRGRVAGLEDFAPGLLYVDRAAHAIGLRNAERLTGAERGEATDDLAYLIYTSGTTGKPKGVAIEHASICNFVRVAAEVYGLRMQDRVYQGMTIAFDFSVEEIWVPWMAGATLVPKPAGASLLGLDLHSYLTERRITALCCVPTLLATVEEDLPLLRFLLVSGEACPQDLIARWHRPGRRFLNVYGPTEATVSATWTVLHPGRPVTIGRPLPTYTTVILDPEDPRRALAGGEVGEIGIAGIGLAAGYLNREDLTAKAFVPDFLGLPGNPSGRIYRTGDLGRINADDEIEYLGRIDLQVKIRGYRIELTEIESVLLQVPGISAAVVDTFEPTPGAVELVGYYSLRSDAYSVAPDAITAYLRERLPAYMVPAYLEQLPAIPMTAQDKVDRRALPPPKARRTLGPGGEVVAAATDTERVLAAALARTLGVDRVSVDSDFFADLGANSLLMAQFSARVRRESGLPALSMREIYGNPTVRKLALAVGAAPRPATAGPAGTVVRGSTAAHLVTGVLQLLLALGATVVMAHVLAFGLQWVSAGADLGAMAARSAAFAVGAYVAACVLPIVAKWVLVGRWTQRRFRLWGVEHFRFWLVAGLVRANPLVLFRGTPLYVFYLRALGARIGRGAVILSRKVPVCTDLITIGAGAVIRKDVSFAGYRARKGHLETGPIHIGRDAFVGDASVLDIGVSLGNGAQLGHASSLLTGQVVPDGMHGHGSPAVPTGSDFGAVPPPQRCSGLRRVGYSVVQLTGVAVVLSVLPVGLVLLGTRVPALSALLGPGHDALTTWRLHGIALLLGAVPLVLGLPVGLLIVLTVPRLLNRLIRPGRTYPLYGVHFLATRLISRLTNTFYTRLLGDSVFVTRYLERLGYDLAPVEQTGSNFGLIMAHDTPYLSAVGTGSMISDGLTISNVDYSSTSFRVGPVSIGTDNFFGNLVTVPTGSRVGPNCLVATKAMVPTDGPVRHDVGLLGSPPFEIPRSVQRDGRFDHLRAPDVLPGRLAAKTRHNAVTIGIYLLVLWFLSYLGVLGALAAVDLFSLFGAPGIAVAAVGGLLVAYGTLVLVERASTGFRALTPRFCSIYEEYFWSHERFWKLTTTAAFDLFNGTAFKGVVLRLLGVRVGCRVFDDGCSIPEKSLVTIGSDTVLGAGSALWGHTLEDGTFKSDRVVVGAGATVGTAAFVLYGAVLGDGAVLEADAFVLKGEEVAPFARWWGNPATEVRAVVAAPAPSRTNPSAAPPDPATRPIRQLTHEENAMTVVSPSRLPVPAPRPSPTPRGARPHVATPLPGPRSAELLARQERRESNARVYPRHFPFAVAEASGSHIRDLDGNVFIDFLSGAGVLSLGHNHPELVAVATEQMGVFTHGLDMPSPAKDAFTDAQLSMLPASMRDRMKIQFCGPTGANAVDAAIKLCKTATGRGGIVSFQGGFHGSSHAAMALTGNVSQKRPIANGVPGVTFFPFSSCSRCPLALDPETCQTNCVSFLERALRDPNGGLDLPAAVIMEMVQGEGGVIPAREEFVRRVRELTRELGIPLIVDEVQTGCGRTGTWFAFEQYGIEPDVIVASKALSGMGLPVAIVMYAEELDTWAPGAHTGTFRGNQLAFAAGAKAVEIVRRDDVLGNVRARGEQIAARLAGLAAHPGVLEVRGAGLMWGIELVAPGDGRTVTELAEDVQARALRGGLIVELGGRDDCVVRMLPPLNVTGEVVDIAVSILLHAIEGAYVGTTAAA